MNNKINLDNYDSKDATHYLSCRHQIGRNSFNYNMSCIPINKMKSGKTKIIVFGDRYWKGKEHVKKIRYVYSNRLSKIV